MAGEAGSATGIQNNKNLTARAIRDAVADSNVCSSAAHHNDTRGGEARDPVVCNSEEGCDPPERKSQAKTIFRTSKFSGKKPRTSAILFLVQ